MSDSPFRERRIPADEARRIVARAAQEAQRPQVIDDAPAVTETELARKLAELGLPDEAIRTAIKEGGEGDGARAQPTVALDGVYRVLHTARIDGEIPPARHEELADAMSNAMGFRGRVEVVGQKLTWTPGGMLQEPALTVRSRDGHTELRVEETVSNRGQRIVGQVMAGFFAAMFTSAPGIAIAKMLGAQPHTPSLVAFVLAFVAMWASAAAFGARRLFRRRHRTRNRDLAAVLRNVEDVARRLVTSGGAERVRVAETSAASPAVGAEVEAEAEAEAIESAELEATHVAKPV